jgi:hypothetical protein
MVLAAGGIQTHGPHPAETQLALAMTRGYDSFNIKLGYPQTPEYDLQLVRTVCNFAPDGFH